MRCFDWPMFSSLSVPVIAFELLEMLYGGKGMPNDGSHPEDQDAEEASVPIGEAVLERLYSRIADLLQINVDNKGRERFLRSQVYEFVGMGYCPQIVADIVSLYPTLSGDGVREKVLTVAIKTLKNVALEDREMEWVQRVIYAAPYEESDDERKKRQERQRVFHTLEQRFQREYYRGCRNHAFIQQLPSDIRTLLPQDAGTRQMLSTYPTQSMNGRKQTLSLVAKKLGFTVPRVYVRVFRGGLPQ